MAQKSAGEAPGVSKQVIVDAICTCLRQANLIAEPALEHRARLANCYFSTAARYQADFDHHFGDYLDISSDEERATYLRRVQQELKATCQDVGQVDW